MTAKEIVLAAAADQTSVAGIVMPTWVLWILAISIIVGAAHTIYTKAVVPLGKVFRRISAIYEKVMEYDDRLKTVESHTVQLKNNGGSSVKDAVDRIEVAQAETSAALREHLDWARDEFAQVWKGLAARDVVSAAEKANEKIERGG